MIERMSKEITFDEFKKVLSIAYKNVDEINISYQQAETMINVYNKQFEQVPGDIVFNNTIPLEQIIIKLYLDDEYLTFKFITNGLTQNIYDNNDIDQWAEIVFGYLIHAEIAFRLSVRKGDNEIYIIDPPIFLTTHGKASWENDRDCIENVIGYSLFVWHAVQIYSLFPKTQEIFRNYTKTKNPEYRKATPKERNEKRISKYIKRYYIDDQDIDKVLYGNSKERKINRQCLVWYVIGHWRKYKNGKMIFINGYWKGELRDIKQNMDDRERLIN